MSLKHYTDLKPVTKDHILYDLIYMKPRIGKYIESQKIVDFLGLRMRG